MNRSGFGARGAKSLSSTSNGKRNVIDVGPDRIIQYVGGDDIVIWLDSTDPRLAPLANGAGAPTWYDKSANEGHMVQINVSEQPTYLYNAINGRPAISADHSSFQNYTGSTGHITWSSQCSVLLLARFTGGEGSYYAQHVAPFSLSDPNISFNIRSDYHGSLGGSVSRYIQAAIGRDPAPPPEENIQWGRYYYVNNSYYGQQGVLLTVLDSFVNGNRFGLIHNSFEIQLTSSATRNAPFDCPGPVPGCETTGALAINAYNKDMSAVSQGATFGPGITVGTTEGNKTFLGNITQGFPPPLADNPLQISGSVLDYPFNPPPAVPDTETIENLYTLGWGKSDVSNPRSHPGMFRNIGASTQHLGADIAFFLGIKRLLSESEMCRLSEAVLSKFGSNSYSAGDYSDIL